MRREIRLHHIFYRGEESYEEGLGIRKVISVPAFAGVTLKDLIAALRSECERFMGRFFEANPKYHTEQDLNLIKEDFSNYQYIGVIKDRIIGDIVLEKKAPLSEEVNLDKVSDLCIVPSFFDTVPTQMFWQDLKDIWHMPDTTPAPELILYTTAPTYRPTFFSHLSSASAAGASPGDPALFSSERWRFAACVFSRPHGTEYSLVAGTGSVDETAASGPTPGAST